MENTILSFNNSFGFSLKQTMNNVNDLLYNFESLKQLQWNIDKLQELKDEYQLALNMASLTYLRKYILDEEFVGPCLFRNLIRRYYPLNDEQILIYENILRGSLSEGEYYLTNKSVLNRKGYGFQLDEKHYYSLYNKNYVSHTDMIHEFTSSEIASYHKQPELYRVNYKIDFHNDERIRHGVKATTDYRNGLIQNEFTIWDWDLVNDIKRGVCTYSKEEKGLRSLLWNGGFIAQMGIDSITETLNKLQEISNLKSQFIDEAQKYYADKRYMLYSYLPISKEFILEHQNELDWSILQRNPRILWDLELIKILLRKIKSDVCETEWVNNLNGTHAMYSAIESFLNDDILSDIEKLYKEGI